VSFIANELKITENDWVPEQLKKIVFKILLIQKPTNT